jgi:hypothetical protein
MKDEIPKGKKTENINNSYSWGGEKVSQNHNEVNRRTTDILTLNPELISHLVNLKLAIKEPTLLEVKNAYRVLVLKHHPDKFHFSDYRRKENEKIFKNINDSYNYILSHIDEK